MKGRPGAAARHWGWGVVLAGLGVLQGCGVLPAREVRDRQVRVTAEAPAPPACPDPLRPLREALALPLPEAEARWGREVAEAALGNPEARVRVLALAVRLPPARGRRADLDRLFPPGEDGGVSDPLEQILLAAARRVPPPAPAQAEPKAADEACRRRLAKAEEASQRAQARVRDLEQRLRRREEENRALERQIEELKTIERILEHRRTE